MGIRFQCHHCSHPLHVKDYQAGKKGRCPQCKGQFRIPLSDADYSLDPATVLVGVADDSTSQMMPSVESLPTNSHASQASFFPNQSQVNSSPIDEYPAESFDSQELNSSSTPSNIALDNQSSESYDINLTQPFSLAEAPNATWYVRPASGGQYGPAPAAVFWQWLLEGRIDVDALVWRDDWAEWQPASSVFADYFTRVHGISTGAPAVPAHSAADIYSQVTPTAQGMGFVPGSVQPVLPTNVATTVTSPSAPTAAPAAVKRQMQKRSRKAKYLIAIGFLAFLMISLAIGLVVVLYRQKAAG